ncbi:MAG: hypothetical protein COV74_01335 [Candidatus Omnitrophica bacterium CG11_big_fil_rev_8_21_14_0_20_45_26]|uniref:CusB-like beta-barrel domain-containing protein n=1 Tax=Candidatus Abzuiibacterium crystallinum TaxID=1974748 RepID=A0A2H0LRX6_9BACT|nr:MAG: hypothetical protein COV74_01335 [Candidatus Omnitrophica bacterium CG11_big_fil_rev_8_21_14_0_20_45_26]PIW64813.1 MAG: hypothetical protein COW12_04745 [Candidatus Omnitrophica bacterium CG12_big_fil_rev_8_21_14_0_65_45_16]
MDSDTNTAEPSLFEEKLEKTKGSGKWLLLAVILFLIWRFLSNPGTLSGEATLQSQNHVLVSANAAGLLREIVKREGASIQKDELVIRLENPDLVNKLQAVKLRIEILNAERDLLMRECDYREQALSSQQILLENGAVTERAFQESQLKRDASKSALIAKEKELAMLAREKAVLEDNVSHLDVRSPFSGMVVSDPSKRLGNYIVAGEFLFDLVDPDSFFLEFKIPESMMHLVSPGDAVTAKFDALPGKSFGGEIVELMPTIKEETEKVFKIKHVATCRIRLNSFPPDAKVGMTARVTVKPRGLAEFAGAGVHLGDLLKNLNKKSFEASP